MIITSEVALLYPRRERGMDDTVRILRCGQDVTVICEEGDWLQVLAVLTRGRSGKPSLIEGWIRASEALLNSSHVGFGAFEPGK